MLSVKRLFDIVSASFLIILILPFLIIIAIAVHIKLGKPIFYIQTRAGKNGKPFKIYKFRTMLDLRNEKGELLPDGQRLTSLGGFLRKTSLDELPEIFNVLKGNMSLVGPRPLLIRYLKRYTPEQEKRLKFVPGITGLAQVRGRNLLSWEEKFKQDVWYVEHWSMFLDIKIIFMTTVKLIKKEGILEGGGADFQEFWGKEIPQDGVSKTFPVDLDEKE